MEDVPGGKKEKFESYQVGHKRKRRAIKEKTGITQHASYRTDNIDYGTEAATNKQKKKEASPVSVSNETGESSETN